MYLRYGNYQHADGEAELLTAKEILRDQAGRAYGIRETWTIRGMLIPSAATQAATQAALVSLENAYSFDFLNLSLHRDDGSVARQLNGITPIGGVRVLRGPSLIEGTGNQWGGLLSYEIVMEGSYQVTGGFGGGAISLLSWTEALTFAGGGPRIVFLETATGPPQKQVTRLFTTFHAVQQGSAVGLLTWPAPPVALFPGALAEGPEIIYQSPKRSGSKFLEYQVEWRYQFRSAARLFGEPSYWR